MLKRCLDSFANQTLQTELFEVIVVDDGSTDGTDQFLLGANYPFRLHCIKQENAGPSQARNAGVKSAIGKFIAFTEDDVTVSKDWLANAHQHLQHGSLDMLEGVTLYEHTKEPVRRFEEVLRHSFIPCNLFVRRSLFELVGGYDSRFYDPTNKLYFREDADLGFRLLDAGASTQIAADVIVEHPMQFAEVYSVARHLRRYYFDPLLYKKHPIRFRKMIEVKDFGGMTVHRPQHYVALVYALSLLAAVVSTVMLNPLAWIFGACVVCCSFAFRYKYQGWNVLRVYEWRDTLGFLIMPGLYLVTLLRGCMKFKSYGLVL